MENEKAFKGGSTMSIPGVRKSLLGAAAAAAILFGGLWAGRIAAGPLGHGRRFSADRVFARIADRLDLSDSQRDQIKGILKGHKDAILQNIGSVRAARLGVRQAIEANPVDESGIRRKAAELGRAEGEAAVLRAQIKAEILPVLNDDQKEKLAEFRSRAEGTGDRVASSVQEFLSK
jgi:Spy/CpxP family protein refolding chaperone